MDCDIKITMRMALSIFISYPVRIFLNIDI